MDILITTPKTEIENARKEGKYVEDGGYWFRVFKFRPQVEERDKIFFVENGQITGYGIIFQIVQKDQEECEATRRIWGKEDEKNWFVYYKNWHWLKNPIPFKGFQGIRYISRIPKLFKNLEEL